MIKRLIAINRRISRKVGTWTNNFFGQIDDCEEIFDKEVKQYQLKNVEVLEIGGTQRPYFIKEEVKYYVGLDIDENFNWERYYHRYLNQSCTVEYPGKFDLIISKYLLEHVDNNSKTFDNIIKALKSAGVAIHIFPLGYHPYTLITRVIGTKLQRALIKIVRPHTAGVTGYPVYYNLCDSTSLKTYFNNKKDVSIKVKYFFGADDYFAFFLPLYILSILFNRVCELFGLNIFASNAVLVIKKI